MGPPSATAALDFSVLEAAKGASTVDEALLSIVSALLPLYPLSRASLRRIDTERAIAIMVGVWAHGPTGLAKGVAVPLHLTSFGRMRSTARSQVDHDLPPTVLDDMLKDEGIRSWVTSPLFRGEDLRGLLSLSTRVQGAFKEEDRYFFDGVALALQDSLVTLLERPVALLH
jgi:hypothetical protein